jgi:NAD(P)-dependent dehydrogenase (short-subunit alcohol dehydrogenase family)
VALTGRAGIVTGAASGIGRASAQAFAAAGAAVVVSDLQARREGGEETVALIEDAGGVAAFHACDVTSAADQQALVEHALARHGRLDFAHNNAGIDHAAETHELEEADFDRVIAVDLKGVWLGMKHQLRAMLERGGGAIVNTSSLAGLVSVPGLGAYSAAKHGVLGLTKAAALEYADRGVRVNAVCPAAVRTPITEALPDEIRLALPQTQAIKRYAEPEEIGAVVVWLCSDAASFVTGVAMPVDGGALAM